MMTLPMTVLVAASFGCYLLLPSTWRERRTALVFLLVIAAHHAVSLSNVYLGPLPGADLDANTFHVNAESAVLRGGEPRLSIGTGAYEWLLYSVYRLAGPDKLLGQSLSVLMFALVLVMVVRLVDALRMPVSRSVLLLLAGLMPSALFFASLTFREVFQLAGVVAGLLGWALAMRSGQLRWLAASFVGYVAGGLFHHVLLAMGMLLFTVGACIWYAQRAGSWRRALAGVAVIAVLLASVGSLLVTRAPTSSGNDYVRMLQRSGSVTAMVSIYRGAVDSANPRSSYGFEVDTDTPLGLGVGLLKSYAYYLAGPMPAQVGRDIDWIPLLNSVLRMVGVLALGYLVATRRVRGAQWFPVLVFFGITLMWSLGTTNFGQAFRHHALTDWLVAVWLAVAAAARAGRADGLR